MTQSALSPFEGLFRLLQFLGKKLLWVSIA